ncbi:hypothetical protein M9458_052875, partial [Cirrhinus mrigala]
DCHYLGISNSFDHQRMLKSARVCEVKTRNEENGRNHICFRDKVADSIYDMFHTRYTLYLQAYQHKIVNIIEEKISEALLAAKDKSTKLSQAVESISEIKTHISGTEEVDENTRTNVLEKFTKLTDHIFEEILYSTDDELKDARTKLQDVVKRRLPKCVGENRISQNMFENKQLLQ